MTVSCLHSESHQSYPCLQWICIPRNTKAGNFPNRCKKIEAKRLFFSFKTCHSEILHRRHYPSDKQHEL